ncbi:AMP-binding protein [Azospirillum sp. B21]|uniref:AMP-binding protein n=1 Tax=Azospirillum sp. B21 TaxID=2607496 RepID=UPI0011ED023F|nr:AMP-binding protein [Azospirillum sp. B21]KAA0575180.1 AMP-binding protein [Azospirillum sp. B21]
MDVSKPMPGVVYPSAEDVARYRAMGLFGDETMPQAFRRIATRFADRVAVSNATDTVTFRELDERSDCLAAGLLDAGLKPLDRATFQVGNSIELVVAFVACLKAGVIPICTLVAHRAAEIGYLSRHAGARAHFIHTDDAKFDFLAFSREVRSVAPSLELTIVARGDAPGGDPSVKSAADLAARQNPKDARERLLALPSDPGQVAVFQLSGGTSGVPKIIPRFHNEYLYQIKSVADFHGLNEHTVAFSPAPMLHNAPIICYWGSAFFSGGEVVCARSLEPALVAATIAARRPNWMGIPLPTLIALQKEGLLDRSWFENVRMSVSESAWHVEELTGALGVPLYGMTEGIICYGRIGDPKDVLDNTVGRPVGPADEYRIVDPETGAELPEGQLGEFVFRGPSSCRGYFDAEERNREAFTPDGFCKSGDLMRIVRIDGQRYVTFEGRVKDVVSRGGEKINCQEVEKALIDHPAIGAIAVVPMPDPIFGERTCAFIIPNNGEKAPTVSEAGAYLDRAGIAKFKWPERIEEVNAFPMTSSGKISKPLLREEIKRILSEERA